MAATEICFVDQSCDDLNVDELLNIDTSLLMSFLEDSQGEGGGDGEMLRAMIQSLEPEIVNLESCSETDESSEEYCRFSEVDEVECCSTSPQNHPDFEWMYMEMDYFSGRFIGNTVEFGGLDDYSQVCYEMAMEEDDYIGLWQ